MVPTIKDVLSELAQEHVQNDPGGRDPIQCRKDLQMWPCDIRMLLDEIDRLRHRVRLLELGDNGAEDLDED